MPRWSHYHEGMFRSQDIELLAVKRMLGPHYIPTDLLLFTPPSVKPVTSVHSITAGYFLHDLDTAFCLIVGMYPNMPVDSPAHFERR